MQLSQDWNQNRSVIKKIILVFGDAVEGLFYYENRLQHPQFWVNLCQLNFHHILAQDVRRVTPVGKSYMDFAQLLPFDLAKSICPNIGAHVELVTGTRYHTIHQAYLPTYCRWPLRTSSSTTKNICSKQTYILYILIQGSVSLVLTPPNKSVQNNSVFYCASATMSGKLHCPPCSVHWPNKNRYTTRHFLCNIVVRNKRTTRHSFIHPT